MTWKRKKKEGKKKESRKLQQSLSATLVYVNYICILLTHSIWSTIWCLWYHLYIFSCSITHPVPFLLFIHSHITVFHIQLYVAGSWQMRQELCCPLIGHRATPRGRTVCGRSTSVRTSGLSWMCRCECIYVHECVCVIHVIHIYFMVNENAATDLARLSDVLIDVSLSFFSPKFKHSS